MSKVTVTASLIPCLAPFMGQRDVRHYLNGFWIEPCAAGGCYLVATDGHRMAVIHDPDARAPHGVILQASPELLKYCRGRKTVGAISFDAAAFGEDMGGSRAVIVHTAAGSVYNAEQLNGRFPDWQRVVPDAPLDKENDKACALSMNVSYVGDLSALFPSRYGGACLQSWGAAGDHSVLATDPAFPDRFAVIMPMRLGKGVGGESTGCDFRPAIPGLFGNPCRPAQVYTLAWIREAAEAATTAAFNAAHPEIAHANAASAAAAQLH